MVIKPMRFIIAALLSFGLLLTVPVVPAPAAAPAATVVFTVGSLNYSVNGQVYAMDVAPVIEAGRTLIPVRFLAQALGATPRDVDWDAATGTVTVNLEENGGWGRDIVLSLVVGSRTMTVINRPGSRGIQAQFISTRKVQMDAVPEIVDGRTMVPVRWVVQALGYALRWDPAGQSMVITG